MQNPTSIAQMPPSWQPQIVYYLSSAQPGIAMVDPMRSNTDKLYTEKRKKSILIMSYMQIGVGLAGVLMQSVITGLINRYGRYYWSSRDYYINPQYAPGIWTGIFFVLCGAIGRLSVSLNRFGWIVSFMILNILAAILAFILLFFMGVATALNASYSSYSSYDNNGSGALVVSILLLLLAICEMIISIWSSAICCGAVCCRANASASPVYYSVTGGVPTQYAYLQQPGSQSVPASVVIGRQIEELAQSSSTSRIQNATAAEDGPYEELSSVMKPLNLACQNEILGSTSGRGFSMSTCTASAPVLETHRYEAICTASEMNDPHVYTSLSK